MQRIPVRQADDSSPNHSETSNRIQPGLDFTVGLASRLMTMSHIDLSKAVRFTDLELYSSSFPQHACHTQLLMYHLERSNLRTAQKKLLDLVTKKSPLSGKSHSKSQIGSKSAIVNLNDQFSEFPSISGHSLPNLTTSVTSASKKAHYKKRLKEKNNMPVLNLPKIDSRRL
jgi:hypothetical protein